MIMVLPSKVWELLTIVNGNINASKYIDITENNVWPIIAHHFTNNEYISQDDNAPVH